MLLLFNIFKKTITKYLMVFTFHLKLRCFAKNSKVIFLAEAAEPQYALVVVHTVALSNWQQLKSVQALKNLRKIFFHYPGLRNSFECDRGKINKELKKVSCIFHCDVRRALAPDRHRVVAK